MINQNLTDFNQKLNWFTFSEKSNYLLNKI